MIGEQTDIQGTGFIDAQDIPRTQVAVFEFNWLSHSALSPELLERAAKQLPSNGVPTALTSKP